ncbi:hypothetical protein ACP0SJ_02220 [Campylobacter jejuni]|uniref:hypothetical protein n=1 Tax=Campylobacter TaxID=194 RepID=UPI000AE6AEAA|nr:MULTISPECIES: hypothetical protein [Campylobacter]EHM1375023.1 hypothetical protein [Campylobacter jejuni]EIM3968377.1 hypothetical protein [Campylobacter jejuni]EIV1278820.1 hypothetical protein [Campylobacter jejuni]HBD2710046.1 hypothetical protein [Campylobacter jejuni]HDV6516109.1 hypothetical protein [Campylobacter jejuni]
MDDKQKQKSTEARVSKLEEQIKELENRIKQLEQAAQPQHYSLETPNYLGEI